MSVSPGSWLALLGLLQDQRAIDVVGNADAAGLGEGFRILLGQHRAPHAGARRIAERAFALEAVGHLREHLVEKHRLEIGRGGLGLGLRLRRHLGQGVGQVVVRTAVVGRRSRPWRCALLWMLLARLVCITSPRCRPGSRRRP